MSENIEKHTYENFHNRFDREAFRSGLDQSEFRMRTCPLDGFVNELAGGAQTDRQTVSFDFDRIDSNAPTNQRPK